MHKFFHKFLAILAYFLSKSMAECYSCFPVHKYANDLFQTTNSLFFVNNQTMHEPAYPQCMPQISN